MKSQFFNSLLRLTHEHGIILERTHAQRLMAIWVRHVDRQHSRFMTLHPYIITDVCVSITFMNDKIEFGPIFSLKLPGEVYNDMRFPSNK